MKTNIGKRMTALLFCLCFISACFQVCAESKTLEGKPYPNSNLYGNWPSERPGPEESFELYANFDAYQEALANRREKPVSVTSLSKEEILEQILGLCTGTEKTDTETEILRILYRMGTDTESIDRAGIAPLQARVDRVKAVKTLDELNRLLQEEGFLINPALIACSVRDSRAKPGKASVTIYVSDVLDDLPMADDATEEELIAGPQKDTETPRKILERLGYPEDHAAHLVEEMVRYDDLSLIDYGIDLGFEVDFSAGAQVLSLREVRDRYFPIYSLLTGVGFADESRDSDPMYEIDQMDLLRLMTWYREENLELLKAILVLSLYHDGIRYVDRSGWDENPNESIYDVMYVAGIPMDQAYLNHFGSAEIFKTALNLLEELREAMRERIRRNEWMDEETKKKAEEKLNMIGIMRLEAEGGAFDCEPLLAALRESDNLLDAAVECCLFNRKCMMRYAGQEVGRDNTYIYKDVAVLENRAKALMDWKMIAIGAPMLNCVASEISSRETMLATLGYMVAHEMGHFFDIDGVRQDASGTGPIYTEEDGMRFMERQKFVYDKLGSIELLNGVQANADGIAELLPDLTGISLVLDLARKTEGFDYDRFFRAYAGFHFTYDTDRENLIYLNATVPYPAGYIRVNYVVAQFEEFYRTYPSVTEGTPMYIAPEDREVIW